MMVRKPHPTRFVNLSEVAGPRSEEFGRAARKRCISNSEAIIAPLARFLINRSISKTSLDDDATLCLVVKYIVAFDSTVVTVPEIVASRSAAICLENVVHKYGDRTALDGVSFDVRPAELFGLLGPNGSGKTTLFRILSTLMIPVGGRATIMGFDVARDPNSLRREIGVVFQAQSIDMKLTAAENLTHQGHLYGLHGKALQARIKEMLNRVGLADRAHEKAETFSGGMQRRLELAKGLLHHPSVLLLDEPTTGLDPGARRDLWQYLAVLRDEEQVTVLVTTHLMEEAERCDRLAILNEGRVVALGTPDELKHEIGGDVIVLDAKDPEALAARMRQRFQVDAQVLQDQVRIEREQGHRFITDVVEAFPGEIEAISVSKPTLEDVFIHRTGHRFWTDEQEKS
jgi:ABC-2 type transport system ATP-binding protein